MNKEENNIEIIDYNIKKSNKSKIVIILLSILVLGLLALCVYNNYQLKIERDKQNNNTFDNKTNENMNLINEDVKKDTEEKFSTYGINSQIINDTENEFTITQNINKAFIVSNFLGNSNNIKLTIDYDKLKEDYGINTSLSGFKYYNIEFSKKVVDLLVSTIENAVGGDVLIALLEDGTLEYIPLYDAVKDNNIKSYGEIDGIKNIIKLYNVSQCPKNSEVGCTSSILAQDKDHKLYNLRKILINTKKFSELN